MTRNQLAYWELQEKMRSNRATERETNRSNVAKETETSRSNLAKEGETHRFNLVTEALERGKQAETKRSNLAHEYLTERGLVNTRNQIAEQARHNRATESLDRGRLTETERTNKANEGIRSAELAEKKRNNQVREVEEGVRLGISAVDTLGGIITRGMSSRNSQSRTSSNVVNQYSNRNNGLDLTLPESTTGMINRSSNLRLAQ